MAALNTAIADRASARSIERGIDRARRRSRIIQGLRIASLLIMLVIAVNAMVQIAFDQPTLSGVIPEAPSGEFEQIINPRFTGLDAEGAPFVVTALSATRQPMGATGTTELDRPQLDYSMLSQNGDMSAVLARIGLYNPIEETLQLVDDVSLTTRSGYTFNTTQALFDLENAEISGANPVRGEAPWGEIRAEGFHVYDRGRHIQFMGGVVTRLYDEPDETSGVEEQD